MLTAGYYGQDRFESVASGGASAKISGRRVLIEVRPGSLAELDFKVRRFAFHPTLSPQASDGEPFKPVGE